MQLSDIIALARAGFSAEQISQLSAADQPQPAPAAPAPQPDPQPAPAPQPAQPEPQTNPQPAQPAPAQDPYQAIMAELGLLKGQLQQINRAGAQQPPSQELTGEQVLARIIAPPKPGGTN